MDEFIWDVRYFLFVSMLVFWGNVFLYYRFFIYIKKNFDIKGIFVMIVIRGVNNIFVNV